MRLREVIKPNTYTPTRMHTQISPRFSFVCVWKPFRICFFVSNSLNIYLHGNLYRWNMITAYLYIQLRMHLASHSSRSLSFALVRFQTKAFRSYSPSVLSSLSHQIYSLCVALQECILCQFWASGYKAKQFATNPRQHLRCSSFV